MHLDVGGWGTLFDISIEFIYSKINDISNPKSLPFTDGGKWKGVIIFSDLRSPEKIRLLK